MTASVMDGMHLVCHHWLSWKMPQAVDGDSIKLIYLHKGLRKRAQTSADVHVVRVFSVKATGRVLILSPFPFEQKG